MRSFEILVANDEFAPSFDPGSPTPQRRPTRRGAREVLDIFIGGVNVTARVADRQAPAVLRDLGLALAGLAQKRRGKILVRFYDDPWELCVERMGSAAALSVYRTGSDPFVVAYDERASFAEIHARVLDAVKKCIERGSAPAAVAVELDAAASALEGVSAGDLALEDEPLPAREPVTVEVERDFPVALGAEFVLRKTAVHGLAASPDDEAAPVERADLHALLFRGRIRAEVRGRAVDLGEGHPFLFAERLLAMSTGALGAWEHGQPQYVRAEAGGILIAIRLSADGDAALTLGNAARAHLEHNFTFPALSVSDLVEASLAFGRALARAVLRRDRAQCTNLRLSAFRRQLRETADCLRDVCRDDAKTNPTPEPYRAFVAASRPARATETDSRPPPARLRYSERWRALVPGIDLRATFLCGDRLIVGAAAETFCLDRASGQVLWRVPTTRATAVVTPGGLARITGDGEIAVHDFGNGDITMRTHIDPRLGAPPAGAVVSLAGLPRLLIVTEGERHLSAIDLTNGEHRWRFAWGRGGALRMRRAGRLLSVASGASALTAIDVQSGSVVWRVRNRLRFRASPTLDHDVLMAVAGGANSAAELLAIDPYSGQVRFQCPIAPQVSTVEGPPLIAGRVVACAVRLRHGLRLAAFCRETGRELWKSEGSVAPVGTSWLAVDGLFIGNCPTGELVAVEAETGALRYRHVLGRSIDADVPRRLEPVLRSGALFVPHVDVHVFRPHDGTEIAKIGPCDAIPDLLRVDERCDVYVAEESGHLASFAVGPRLTLVK